jgi:hypothetical protein
MMNKKFNRGAGFDRRSRCRMRPMTMGRSRDYIGARFESVRGLRIGGTTA